MRTISFISFYRERCPGDLQWWADGPLIYSSLFNSQYICCIRQYCMPLTFSLLTHAVCAFSYVLLFCVLLCFCASTSGFETACFLLWLQASPTCPVFIVYLLFAAPPFVLHSFFELNRWMHSSSESTRMVNSPYSEVISLHAGERWLHKQYGNNRTDCRKISFILSFGTITLRRTWKKKNWTYKLCREFILFNVLHLCWAYL